jgi:pilus assembly protein Flp/PilA
MLRIHRLARCLGRDERGATSIEYGMIALLVAVGMLVGLRALGQSNESSWNDSSSKLVNAMQGK